MHNPVSESDERTSRPSTIQSRAEIAFIAFCLLAIAGRVLSYPINRDENLFLTVSQQWPSADIYADLGFNHLPNFVLLLGGLLQISGVEHYLLAGRLLIVVGWTLSLVAIWLVGRRLNVSFAARQTGMALLVGNVAMLGPPGMLVTNSLWPIPFAILSFYFLLGALDVENSDRLRFREAFLSGACVSIAIGLKANFIILAGPVLLATIVAPTVSTLAARIRCQVIPLGLGGLIGGMPSIAAFLRDSEGMIVHTVLYFTQLHRAFWMDSVEPKAITFQEKILLADNLWLSDATLLTILGIALFALMPLRKDGWAGVIAWLRQWPVLLAIGLTLCGVVVSFVPTPSFTQYFLPPIPFLLLLFLVLAPRGDDETGSAGPSELTLVLPLFAIAMLGASTRLIPGLLMLAQPGEWPGVGGHDDLQTLLTTHGIDQGDRIAAMTPILAIEGGAEIYPEFAAGQFVYRLAPYMSEEDRAFYRTTSRDELTRFLDANPPDAIIVNHDEPIERDLAEYAEARGFREIARPSANGMPPLSLLLPPPDGLIPN